MGKKSAEIYRLVPMVVVMGAIFFLSHQPGDSLYVLPFPGFDKLAHMGIYGVLAASVLYAFYSGSNKSKDSALSLILITVSICTLYGIGDEFHQSFIPGRFASFADIVADTLGAVVVAGAWFLWNRRSFQ